MPITEREHDYDWMKAHQSPAYVCEECGGQLTLAWGGNYGISGDILRCGRDIRHKGDVKIILVKEDEMEVIWKTQR